MRGERQGRLNVFWVKTEIKVFYIYLNVILKKFKFNYFILDVKLLLINMNHVNFFFDSLKTKNLTKFFTPIDVAN